MRDLVHECLPAHDHYMASAWLGLLSYAAGVPEIIEQFEKDSGMKMDFPKGIAGLIDQQSGYNEERIFAFAHWVTENLWGDTSE